MTSKRKAWDETIQKMTNDTTKASRSNKKRESTRRVNARRWIATNDSDDLKRKILARLENLESTQQDAVAEEDEWMEEGEDRGGKKSKSKASDKKKARGIGSLLQQKKFQVRSLAQSLLEDDAGFVARDGLSSYTDAEGGPPSASVAARPICVVTGLLAKYRDPKSGLRYYNKSALNQLKETPPPWLQLSGNAPYYEAMKYMKERRAMKETDSKMTEETEEHGQSSSDSDAPSESEEDAF